MDYKDKKAKLLREAIVDETIRILESEGIQEITIRKISEGLGCSIGVIYNYFRDKNEILKEIYIRTCRELLNELISFSVAKEDPVKHFIELCGFICEFRIKNSARYREIFRQQVFDEPPEELLEIRRYIIKKIKELHLSALNTKVKLEEARFTITALAEGLASTEVNSLNAAKTMKSAVCALIIGWE